MKFHETLEKLLECGNLEVKFDEFVKFYAKFNANEVEFEENFTPKPLTTPSYTQICQVIDMKDMKKVKGSKEAKFLHSIAHIEYSAIDIALDGAYRYVNLPREFYADWLEVADDEIRHFLMINSQMKKLNIKYGDFVVHDGLFIALQKTQNSLLERMAVLPRFMEANGLDANAHLLRNLSPQNELFALLQTILKEEISHVAKGDKWFKFACKKQAINSDIWFDLVLKHYPKSFQTKRDINVKDRLAAGFSQNEIEKIINFKEQL